MIDFLKHNWKVILVGLIGIAIGFALQIYANYRSEQRIIESITAQINELKEKQKSSRISAEEQKQLIELEAQLKLITS